MNIKKITVKTDSITDAISSKFDYQFTGESSFICHKKPDVQNFRIGLIVGPSGSGKSTLLKEFGTELNFEWNPDLAICSHFLSCEDAEQRLSAVGLNSIPSWMKPYHVLSTGERFRADLAMKIIDNSVIDEFTSTIDRNVAKACARSVRRYVDKYNLSGIVLATCHYDVIDWLEPDWVFDTSNGELLVNRGLHRRPSIKIELLPCSTQAWPLFSKHHYLTGNINKSSRCWIALWGKVIVGFCSVIAYPSGTVKNAWRGHRTVVLPDFQGLGIGVRISDAVAKIMVDSGYRYFSKTSHPRMGEYREKSSNWRPTSKNKKNRKDYSIDHITKEDGYKMLHKHRVCYSHEYIG